MLVSTLLSLLGEMALSVPFSVDISVLAPFVSSAAKAALVDSMIVAAARKYVMMCVRMAGFLTFVVIKSIETDANRVRFVPYCETGAAVAPS
jgi:hypothetical protein